MNYKMKLLIFLSFIFFFQTNIISQTNFEGKIVFQVKNNNETNQITYLVKGDKFRIEPKTPKGMGVMIYNSKKKMMIILITPKKMYMEVPLDLTNKKSDKKKKTKSYFKNTGKTKKIFGYNSEKFEFVNKGKKGEAWMTKDLGGFLFFRNPKQNSSSQSDWQKAIIAENYFPMVISEINSEGKPSVMFKVLEVKAKNLANSLFEPPAGYQKFDVSKMMKRNN
ncbi:MAG TPA: DUF4412 domain-containing protein [Ignavibacteria bacterium]|nr:DUF4412 domain-containing protein [Ignavibacteria bacterium]